MSGQRTNVQSRTAQGGLHKAHDYTKKDNGEASSGATTASKVSSQGPPWPSNSWITATVAGAVAADIAPSNAARAQEPQARRAKVTNPKVTSICTPVMVMDRIAQLL